METKQNAQLNETFARIKVIGVGGGGCNAVNRMIDEGMHGVEFITVNTDARRSSCPKPRPRFALVIKPPADLALAATLRSARNLPRSSEELYEALKGADMVFVTDAWVVDTGTGAAPIVAQIAKELALSPSRGHPPLHL